MKAMKRMVLIVLSVAMLWSLFACDKGTEQDSDTYAESSSDSVTETAHTTETEAATETSLVDSVETTDAVETVESIATDSETTETSEPIETDPTLTTEADTSDLTETATETITETETEQPVETTETEKESEAVELVYGYDFKDNSWTSLFDMAGKADRTLVNDPAGSGEAVLMMTHGEGQTASWIRNKTPFDAGNQGKITVSVDLYIPSNVLSAAGDYVQMQINGSPDHHIDLVSDAKQSMGPFDTKDFPRDKWFKVRFSFDMDKLRYNMEIVEDGMVRTVVLPNRAASSLKETGPLTLRVFLGGAAQSVYVDHLGLVTGGQVLPSLSRRW